MSLVGWMLCLIYCAGRIFLCDSFSGWLRLWVSFCVVVVVPGFVFIIVFWWECVFSSLEYGCLWDSASMVIWDLFVWVLFVNFSAFVSCVLCLGCWHYMVFVRWVRCWVYFFVGVFCD